MKKLILLAALFAAIALGGFFGLRPETADQPITAGATQATDIVDVIVPDDLSELAMLGKRAFESTCITCHDPPPLIWSAPIVRNWRIEDGNQTTQAGRDCHEVAAG